MKIKDPYCWKEENYEPFNIPPVTTFRGSYELCPWDVFQQWLIEGYGIKKALDIYPRIYLRKEEYDKFCALMRSWVKKFKPGMTKKGRELLIGIYDLQYATNSFYQNPKWSKSKTIYIKKKKVKAKK